MGKKPNSTACKATNKSRIERQVLLYLGRLFWRSYNGAVAVTRSALLLVLHHIARGRRRSNKGRQTRHTGGGLSSVAAVTATPCPGDGFLQGFVDLLQLEQRLLRDATQKFPDRPAGFSTTSREGVRPIVVAVVLRRRSVRRLVVADKPVVRRYSRSCPQHVRMWSVLVNLFARMRKGWVGADYNMTRKNMTWRETPLAFGHYIRGAAVDVYTSTLYTKYIIFWHRSSKWSNGPSWTTCLVSVFAMTFEKQRIDTTTTTAEIASSRGRGS